MTGDTVGGVWTFTLELARAMGDRGIEVTLAAMGGHASRSQRAEAGKIRNLRLFTTPLKLEWMEQPWEDVEAAGDWLLDLEQRVRPDVIHMNAYGAGADGGWKTPVILTAHSCVRSWWRAVRGEEAGAEWTRYTDTVARAVRNAVCFTAPSRFMLESVERDYGPVPRGVVIPNGRSAATFRALPKEPFIFSAGRVWDDAKNLETLARAADPEGWPIYVAGALRGRDGAERSLQGCHTLGRLSAAAVKDWYARASIYALPALYEPFGLSILEAALSDCALLLGDIPSLRENWEGAAIFLPPGDADALRWHLRMLENDGERRRRMGVQARERAAQFTVARMTDAYVRCYRAATQAEEVACAS